MNLRKLVAILLFCVGAAFTIADVGADNALAVEYWMNLSKDQGLGHEVVMSPVNSFLVACTRLYNPLCRSVRPSVRPSVTLYFFRVFAVCCLTVPAQMMK